MLRPALALLLAAAPTLARGELVAIDVLLEPDETMLRAAEAWNERLREQTPEGFELDATHAPHVTLLRTYVAEEGIDAVVHTATTLDIAGLEMKATGLYHIPAGEVGLQGIVIEPSPELLAVREAVIEAVTPFRREGGDEAAFVPDPTGTPFDPFLFEYVETFVPKQSGADYNLHVSTGVGPLAWLEAREAEPFETFTFGADGIAVYGLGNFGTAAERIID